ncbi:MAG: hypothetical protein ACPG8V_05000 [Alphaproteobacteria bacterium]
MIVKKEYEELYEVLMKYKNDIEEKDWNKMEEIMTVDILPEYRETYKILLSHKEALGEEDWNAMTTLMSGKKINPSENKEEFISKDTKVTNEINKVQRRVPKWKNNPNQFNSKILQSFFDLYNNGHNVYEYNLQEQYENQYNGVKFYGNFSQMINFGEKNSGKVFDRMPNGEILLWDPVANFVKDVWNN